ncbi:TIM barrel protein [Phenylobacterium sp. LjRoot219]|uniref:sugar phosphate isomerase/epimerase family protein n=1 Tax=Phenylobacterium sp. LjRoot219 TaxID=3342283 RepID=UPI003ECD8F42
MDRLGIEFISVFGMPPVAFVELARDLGVRHITTGLQPMDYNPHGYAGWSLRDAGARREMIRAMDDCGVSLSGGEGFLVQPGADARAANLANFEAMAELGATRVNSVSFEPDFQRNVEQFGVLAETAAEFGIETMIEFVPIFAVADLATAHRIVQAVGRPDLRLMIDTMHVGRCGAAAQDLAAIKPEAIGYVQLCDCPLQPVIPDYLEEAMYQRLAPGDGELPLREMLAALPRDRIVGLEIPLRSEAEAGVEPRESLARCVAAATRLLSDLDS